MRITIGTHKFDMFVSLNGSVLFSSSKLWHLVIAAVDPVVMPGLCSYVGGNNAGVLLSPIFQPNVLASTNRD